MFPMFVSYVLTRLFLFYVIFKQNLLLITNAENIKIQDFQNQIMSLHVLNRYKFDIMLVYQIFDIKFAAHAACNISFFHAVL